MPSGRVLQVNVSGGGVPKRPVPEARVGPLGLEGDRHRANTVHGGPIRAVCLLATEVIERLQAEGHPIEPGSVGENLTTAGIELADLPSGTRLAVGDELVLEVTSAAMPCDTIVRSFRDGKSGRLSILLHPHDSRMYARVLREGTVREGDGIEVLPPDAASDVHEQVGLFRIESVERFASVALWRAAAAAGFEMEIVDDGELAVGTSPDLPGAPFNQAFGLRPLPYYLPAVLERFRENGRPGWLGSPEPPWADAAPDYTLVLATAQPDAVGGGADGTKNASVASPSGVDVRAARADEIDAWADGPMGRRTDEAARAAWPAILRRLGTWHNHHPFVAVADGEVVATALLVVHRRVGYLTAATVDPAWRGRGLQRALIRARAALASGLGCDLLLVAAAADNAASLRNIERSGFRELTRRDVYRFDPAANGDGIVEEARSRFGDLAPTRLGRRRLEPARPG